MFGYGEIINTIKDVATIVAILGGGGWTIYTFSALGTRARAQAELFKQAVLEVTVEARQESSDLGTNGQLLVSAVAKIVNKGSRNTFLDFREQAPFRVYRVDFNSAGVGLKVPVMNLNVDNSYMTLRTGATGEFPVFFAVSVPGLYVIDFWVDLSTDELKVHEATAQDDAARRRAKIGWSGHTHLVIR
jgi:hypothetical protein